MRFGIKEKSLDTVLKSAKQSGSANLTNRELESFPRELCTFSELRLGDNWWQCEELQKIDLSYNSIPEILPEIATQEYVSVFRMGHNKLTSIPDEFFTFKNLKVIDFSYNLLRNLPDSICGCLSLVEILLQGNQITELPRTIGNLIGLEIIDLKQNQITELPYSFGALKELKKLDLAENALSFIPNFFGQLAKLQELLLSKNRIEYIEAGSLSSLISLRLVDLRENRLESFTEFPDSKQLDTVLLCFNKLKRVEGFENAKALTVLDLKNNKIVTLSPQISQCIALKTLDVSNNDLSDLPTTLAHIKSLVRINIEGNPLRSIRQSIRTAGAEAIKKYLSYRGEPEEEEKGSGASGGYDSWQVILREANSSKQLKLISRGLDSIPDAVWELPQLTHIDLSCNNLTSISPAIENLQNLIDLKLNRNKLTSIPSVSLGSLSNLIELELSNNGLTSFLEDLPINRIRLSKLQRLDLSGNKLTDIPNACEVMTGLRILVLHTNSIRNLDKLSRPAFARLNQLDLSSNNLLDLPEGMFYNLAELTHLNIENNNIGVLPTVMGFHQKLRVLQVDGNPLKTIRRTIIEKGTQELMAYLRNKHTSDTNPLAPVQAEPVPAPSPARVSQSSQPTPVSKSPAQPVAQAQVAINYEAELASVRSQITKLTKKLDEDFSLTVSAKREIQKELAHLRTQQRKLEEDMKAR
jgi:Leucine-rich repeat (LRR) protein